MDTLCRERDLSPRWLFVAILWSTIIFWLVSAYFYPETQMQVFFRQGEDLFRDFINPSLCLDRVKNVYTGEGGIVLSRPDRNYPPLAYVVSGFVRQCCDVPGHVIILLIAFCGCFIGLATALTCCLIFSKLNSSKSYKMLFILGMCLSGVYLFTVERGNYLLIVIPLVCFYLFYVHSSNPVVKELALLSLALAAGIKVSPAIFGLELIISRDWKSACRLLIYGILFGFLPFLALQDGFCNIPVFIENCGMNGQIYLRMHVGFENYAGLLGSWFGLNGWSKNLMYLFYSFSLLAGFVALFLAFFTRRDYLRTLLLTLALLCIPASNNFYVYLYLIPAIVLLFNDEQDRMFKIVLAILLALIFSPFVVCNYRINHALISVFFNIFTGCVLFFAIKEFVVDRLLRQKNIIE